MKKIHLESVPSTNQWAKEHCDCYTEDLLIYTDNQTAGYGRFGRDWQSPPATNLAFSLLLSPPIAMDLWPNCSQVIAVALASYFSDILALKPTLKWPNDILFNGKKAVGILAESITSAHTSPRLIIGVGINVKENKTIEDIVQKPLTSLESMGAEISPLKLMEEITPLLFLSLKEYFTQGFAPFATVWRALGEDTGRRIRLHNGENSFDGTIARIHDDGSLLLKDSHGSTRYVSSGEIEYLSSHSTIPFSKDTP